MTLWRSSITEDLCEHMKEEPAAGYHMSYATWKALNRLRTGVSRCKVNLGKWGYITGDELCEYGERQDPQHLLVCKNLKDPCTMEDLYAANGRAVQTAEFWITHEDGAAVECEGADYGRTPRKPQANGNVRHVTPRAQFGRDSKKPKR
ncbi:hypothetical protein PR048_008286 [Dryococelus australis]|uniref:Uncharacterized protein n=1 Tax=Dryococelus australis TaxID=614101 RepID=A0ABQ9HWP1_9NEOP|nr:hypothetical protein PR048_008286 [Dryococelus australis]